MCPVKTFYSGLDVLTQREAEGPFCALLGPRKWQPVDSPRGQSAPLITLRIMEPWEYLANPNCPDWPITTRDHPVVATR